YRPRKDGRGPNLKEPVSIEQMCREGGVFWYQEFNDWKATVPGYNRRGIEAGFLVSATALSSFASAIRVKSVF
ncbi:MAG TPA: hypothetical protein VIL32_00020, partial [Steroidobacteraceae bacterium]